MKTIPAQKTKLNTPYITVNKTVIGRATKNKAARTKQPPKINNKIGMTGTVLPVSPFPAREFNCLCVTATPTNTPPTIPDAIQRICEDKETWVDAFIDSIEKKEKKTRNKLCGII
jgi:hypothetical protein